VVYRLWYVIDRHFALPYTFLNVSKFHRYFSSTPDAKYDHAFTKDSLKDALEFVLYNAYFTVGKTVYRQMVGLPMGSDCAPHVANLYLYQQESTYFKKTWNRLRHHNPTLINFHRLIDDITTYNDNGMFENHFHEIYDPELNIKRINDNVQAADILDISVSCSGNKSHTTVYDKRRSFKFKCMRLPHVNSLISSATKVNVMKGQLLRIARICNTRTAFERQLQILYEDLRSRGYDHPIIMRSFSNMYNKHRDAFKGLVHNMADLKDMTEPALGQ
jgi:hypothetical protein